VHTKTDDQTVYVWPNFLTENGSHKQGRAMISWGPGAKLLFLPPAQIFVYNSS
jgi:hypothetical protein